MEHRGIISHSPDSSSESGTKRKDTEEQSGLSPEPEEKKQKQEEKKPTKEEEQEEVERVASQAGMASPGLTSSTKEQQAAEELVKTFQPYEEKDPILDLETISTQFQDLQSYLVPGHTKKGQDMWNDDDPMTAICTTGIHTIYKNILDNEPLKTICQQGKLVISPAMGNTKYTLLDFLAGILGNPDTCSQAVAGEMDDWIKCIQEQIKEFKG